MECQTNNGIFAVHDAIFNGDFGEYLTKKFDEKSEGTLGVLLKIGSDEEIKDMFKGIGLSFVECAWSIIWDNIKLSLQDEQLDTYGAYDIAIQTFRDEVNSKFGAHLAAEVPTVVKQIYAAYFGIEL